MGKSKAQDKKEFDIEILDSTGRAAKSFDYMDTMIVRLKWHQPNVANVGVAIFRDNGEYVFGPNTYQDKFTLKEKDCAQYTVVLNLNEGGYFIKAGLMGANDNDTIAFIEEGLHFVVKRDYDAGRWGGVTKLEHSWQ